MDESLFERVLRDPPPIPADVLADWERRGLTQPSPSTPTERDPALVQRLITLRPTHDIAAEIAEVEAEERSNMRANRLAMLARHLMDAQERDVIQATRPEGCWCLGGGSQWRSNGRVFCGCDDGRAAALACDEAERVRREDRHRKTVARLWEAASVPARFADCTLATYPVMPQTRDAVKRIDAWFEAETGEEAAADHRESLFIHGPYGTGKTGIAVSLLRRWIECEYEALFVTVPTLLDRIRQSYDPRYGDGEKRPLLERAQTVEVLVLDDLGAERVTEWAAEKLFTIINERHDECLKTIFTSNLSPGELSGHIGDRIAWRVVEMCNVVHLAGPNLRDRR